ncbi:hypothetical protein TcCL_NonESM03005 [Trypanosoma cruzi]|nr:hypothetical protein TcCL_NonESM03005 [Trypanosoma cruzi]
MDGLTQNLPDHRFSFSILAKKGQDSEGNNLPEKQRTPRQDRPSFSARETRSHSKRATALIRSGRRKPAPSVHFPAPARRVSLVVSRARPPYGRFCGFHLVSGACEESDGGKAG